MRSDWSTARQAIDEGESHTVEFKRELGNLSQVGRAICSFANSNGGIAIIGVDGSGVITGVKEDPDTVQESLTGVAQSGCSAPIHVRCGMKRTPQG